MTKDFEGEKGYIPRDYTAYPEFCAHPEYSGKVYPRSDWVELLELQKKNESSPYHVHKQNKIPILNQGRYGYCWMYGTVACILNRYATQGIDPVPNLNAHAPAAMGKNYRNKGGFGIESTRYIEKYGIPEMDVWPEFSNNKSLAKSSKVKKSCERHKLVTFEELPKNNFDAVVSALLDPVDPCPVTLAYNWWRHLICGLIPVYRGSGRSREWGLQFVNSWGLKYGDQGFGKVWGKKAVPFESIAVRSVKVRSE